MKISKEKTVHSSFIFCLHNHQPIGNFGHIFEWAYNDCYNKSLQIFKEYPEFRFAVHHSGCLMEWIKARHPEYLDDIRMMRERGQIEIIGGGFYEPIFSVISESDIRGQIKLMQDFCGKEFGVTPRGFWTAERVWDPDIPRLVSDFDFYYTVLDDIHFRYAGVDADKLYGYYLTERLDKKLRVFPIDKFLRYSIPFKMPGETVEYFRRKSGQNGECAFVYGDDGEKFGLWPETQKWVYGEKWLRKFIEAILSEDWIKTTLPSEYIESRPPMGRVYLTQGSYFELSEWALPPESALKLVNINREIKEKGREDDFYAFLKGGVWNNFLNKYPESNAINKRTILLSGEISRLEKETGSDLSDMKRELYRGECNCAYWHGLFGGIYLGSLRSALYEHVLKAEKALIDKRGIPGAEVLETDFWNEGAGQILIRSALQSTIITPFAGGAISEIGIYKKSFNILDVLQRRLEAYHEVLKKLGNETDENGAAKSIHDRITVKEPGLQKYLVYDKARRYSFRDIIMDDIPSPGSLQDGSARIYDCGGLIYHYDINEDNDAVSVGLSAAAKPGSGEVSISKKFIINYDIQGVVAGYSVSCGRNLFFGVELNINLLGGHDEDRFYEIGGVARAESYLDSAGTTANITSFSLVDKFNNLRVIIKTTLPVTLVRYPIYTVSQSDSGFEKNFQGSSILLVHELGQGGNTFSVELRVE